MDQEVSQFESAEFKLKCENRSRQIEGFFVAFQKGLYDKLVNDGKITNKSGLSLNATILCHCMHRYFRDLEAERILHATPKPFNGYRQAAFTIKWLLKFRPIVTTTAIPEFITANDEFAFQIGLAMLRCDAASLDETFRKFFTYSLRHGDFSEELMLSMCVLLNPKLHIEQLPTENQTPSV